MKLQHEPSLSTLVAIEINHTTRDKQQSLRRVASIDDLSPLIFHQTVQEVQVSPTKDEKASFRQKESALVSINY